MTKKLRLDQIKIKSLVTTDRNVRGGDTTNRSKQCQTQIWQECSWICPTNLPEEC